MKLRKTWAIVLAIVMMAATLFAVGAFASGEGETVGGWYNYANGKFSFEQVDGDVEMTFQKNTSFGSCMALNDTLAQNVLGNYKMSFDLDANLSKNEEVWVSAIPIYNPDENTVHRVGLHFNANDWMNIAIYGSLGGADKAFAYIVNKNDNFPSLSSTISVEIILGYNESFETIETLKLNGKEIYKVNLSELYINDYFLFDTKSIGFDVYNNSESVMISNVKVEAVQTEYFWTKTTVNNYYAYAKNSQDFVSKRLSAEISTQDTVTAFTKNASILSGMFANGLSHNYIFIAKVKSAQIGDSSEFGFYVWYLDLKNYVLLKSEGVNISLQVVLGGQVAASESAAGSFAVGDEIAVQKYTKLTGTDITVFVNGEQVLQKTDIQGIDENYYIGLYGKKVNVTLEGIGTESYYVPYDFVEEGDWITSGYSETAWDVSGEYPQVESKNAHSLDRINEFSVAVRKKVINDTEASYEVLYNLDISGDFAFGVVPYYKNSAEYVLLGVEKKGGSFLLFAAKPGTGVINTKSLASLSEHRVKVSRDGENFKVEAGGESLEVEISGITEIAEYFGYFVSGQGTAAVAGLSYEGFESFKLYEQENGWITASYKKDDITFDGDTIEINGNYTQANITDKANQTFPKAMKPVTYKNDYVIEVDITKTIEPDGPCQREGVVVWYLDEQNYFVLFIDQWTAWEAYQLNGCGVYKGERMVDVHFNDYPWFLGKKDTLGYINKTIKLKVIRNDQTIKGYLDGDLIFNYTFDPNLYDLSVYDDDQLYLGVLAAGHGAKFENYTVREMTAQEGTPTPSKGNRPKDDQGGATPPPSEDEGKDNTGGCSSCNSALGGTSLIMLISAILAAAISLYRKKREG